MGGAKCNVRNGSESLGFRSRDSLLHLRPGTRPRVSPLWQGEQTTTALGVKDKILAIDLPHKLCAPLNSPFDLLLRVAL